VIADLRRPGRSPWANRWQRAQIIEAAFNIAGMAIAAVLAVWGLLAMIHTPQSIENQLGSDFTGLWTWFAMCGGTVTVLAIAFEFPERSRMTAASIEMLGSVFLVAGILLYQTTVANLSLVESGRIPQAWVLTALSILPIIRTGLIAHSFGTRAIDARNDRKETVGATGDSPD
jgi:hypothetical protein